MPHRIFTVPHLYNDALAMLAVSMASLTSSGLSSSEWGNAIGPYGGYFISLIMLGMFIMRDKSNLKQQREDKITTEAATEKRHKEAMDLQRTNAEKLMELSHEAIKAQFHVAQALTDLKEELSARPCNIKKPIP